VKNDQNVVVIHQVDHQYPMKILMKIEEENLQKNKDHLQKKEKKQVRIISSVFVFL